VWHQRDEGTKCPKLGRVRRRQTRIHPKFTKMANIPKMHPRELPIINFFLRLACWAAGSGGAAKGIEAVLASIIHEGSSACWRTLCGGCWWGLSESGQADGPVVASGGRRVPPPESVRISVNPLGQSSVMVLDLFSEVAG
jgi:hypothetical protein